MAEPVWQFRLSVGNEPLFSVTVRTQGCQTFPNAHPWASHPIALGVSGTGLEAQSSQTDAVKSLIRWESPHPLSIAGVKTRATTQIIAHSQADCLAALSPDQSGEDRMEETLPKQVSGDWPTEA